MARRWTASRSRGARDPQPVGRGALLAAGAWGGGGITGEPRGGRFLGVVVAAVGSCCARRTRRTRSGVRLHGSTLTDVLGVEQLRGAVIDPNQAVPLGLLLLAAFDIVVEDDQPT